MQCQSIIKLNLLTGEEAWSLFKSHANINDDTPNALKVVARKIVNECKGLTIAIVTLGSTLKHKTLGEWKLALSRLEDSKPLDIPRGLTSPHVCLKLSYDNLTNQLAKSLLLLCSIFPEDHKIDLEDLFRFGKGWSLTRTFGTMEKAREEMNAAVNMLKDSCLLLHVNNKKVKMHDLVRDVALWIASERGETILTSTTMDPRMLVEDEIIQDKRVISLWDLKNGQLPDDQLNCSSLEILLLHSPKVEFKVPNSCLERLKMLKILAFLTFDYRWKLWWLLFLFFKIPASSPRLSLLLPQSIELLKNLHTLCLRGYNLCDISIVVKLEALEILDLRGSSFYELPNEIVALKKLKLLDLYYCQIKKDNACEVIRRSLQLEELYLYIIQSKQQFPHNVSLPRLQRYVILSPHIPLKFLNQVAGHMEEYSISKALCIEGFNASVESFISLPIKDLFLRAEYLHLRSLKGGYKNVIPSMDPQGMNQLIVLILKYCSEIECVFESNMTNVEIVFSSLATLYLHGLSSLKEVFNEPSSQCLLKNLQEISIHKCDQLYRISFPRNSKLFSLIKLTISDCPMLTCLFMPSIAQTLVLLESLYISKCSGLKNIIEEEEEGDVDGFSSQSHTSLMLPKLRYLQIVGCDKLEYIFPICIAQRLENLWELIVQNNCEMKYILGTEKEHQSHRDTNFDINLLNLDNLFLDSLPNLIAMWPNYCRPRFSNLKRLTWSKCSKLSNLFERATEIDSNLHQDLTTKEKEIHIPRSISRLELSDVGVKGIYECQTGEATTNTQVVPFNLDLDLFHCELWNLPELKFIWKGPTNFLCLKRLQFIRVDACPKLTTIFSPTIVRSLPMLLKIYISNCEDLEQIFDTQELKSLYTCSQQVCFPQLWSIEVYKCNKLKYLFHNFVADHFPSLSNLVIEECSKLEKGFNFECEADDAAQQGTVMDGQQLPLQYLKDIRLKSLPNFKEIHHGFKLKNRVKFTINNCPKYTSNLYLSQDFSGSPESYF